ncbi:DegT/DnrJ/EryC1/StrS family aminotransferase [Frankia sp. Cas3]|uniref:DegT/DnrJ/EryC1/StrS family aminotransferase n=1 Tax=Frankia sp. Cas3 TaxID=3073926 RepID=UPI002AD3EF3A|nr:DegT/DnrJ/EryC1/StrS family aminotransferase [Frankia sp. Cas3]
MSKLAIFGGALVTDEPFPAELAVYLGADHAITTNSGTSALHTALAALGIGPGDEVICTPYSFIASASCVLQAGALPVFADVDESHTLSAADVEKKITSRSRAIVVVHLYGVVADLDPIVEVARKHGLFVVEDRAQSISATYKGRKVGTVGDVGCFSFCQSKHFTTGGEGGAIVTDDENLSWECRSLRDHGYDVVRRMGLMEFGPEYIHRRVGFNYRLTEMQSAIGSSELARLDSWNLPRRRANGRRLIEALKDHPLVIHAPVDSQERENAFWWAPFVLDSERLSVPVAEFAAAMNAEGVPYTTVQLAEMYRERVFVENNGFGKLNYPFDDPSATPIDYSKTDCATARWLAARTLPFYTHPVYTERHMEQYIRAFEKVAAAFYLETPTGTA